MPQCFKQRAGLISREVGRLVSVGVTVTKTIHFGTNSNRRVGYNHRAQTSQHPSHGNLTTAAFVNTNSVLGKDLKI